MLDRPPRFVPKIGPGCTALCALVIILASPTTGGANESKERPHAGDGRVSLQLGPMVGWRHFRAAKGRRNSLYLDAPMFGGRAAGRYRLTDDTSRRLAVHVVAGGTYAPISWRYSDASDTGSGETARGHHIEGHTDMTFRYRYLKNLAAVGRVGVGVRTETMDRNEFYTGTRYISGRVLAGIDSRPAEGFRFEGLVGPLPTPLATNSGGSYGDAGFVLGWTTEQSLSVDLGNRWAVEITYGLSTYQASWEKDQSPTFRTLDLHHYLDAAMRLSL